MRAALLGILFAFAATSATGQTFDFRGARLGMTVEEWKSLTPPEQLFRKAEPTCSSESGQSWVTLTETEKKAGIVECAYTYPFLGIRARTGQKVGDAEITGATYYFFKNRLYQIELIATEDALRPIRKGLTSKYGPPAFEDTGSIQNRAGATFPQIKLGWARPGELIAVSAPGGGQIDRMLVLFSMSDALTEVEAAKRAVDPKAGEL